MDKIEDVEIQEERIHNVLNKNSKKENKKMNGKPVDNGKCYDYIFSIYFFLIY